MPYNKYYKQKEEVSYDEGESWEDVTPPEYRKGALYEEDSPDCRPTPEPIYRWVNMDITTDYICDETTHTKYYKQKKQVSNDNGRTWQDVTPAEYQRGDVYEMQSTDCGYVPPIPTGIKFQATYHTIDGEQIYSKECDGNPTLETGDTMFGDPYFRFLTSAAIGDCVTVIGVQALSASSMPSIVIPHSVTAISLRAFQGSRIESITIPSSVTEIDWMAFLDCEYLSRINSNADGFINLPNGLITIGPEAFEGCNNFKYVTIPDSVTTISTYAFLNCSGLLSVTIGSGVTSIGSGAFDSCYSLTSVTIGNNVRIIGDYAFAACSGLTSIIIPDSVTYIKERAFNNCRGLTSVTIGNNVVSIGDEAFRLCTNLTSVTCLAAIPPSLGDSVFENANVNAIYVPANSVNAYKVDEYWSTYASIIQPIP